MGIKNLLPYLRKRGLQEREGNLYVSFAGKSLAVDGNYLVSRIYHSEKKRLAQEEISRSEIPREEDVSPRVVASICDFLTSLKRNGRLREVYLCFDGRGVNKLKQRAWEERREAKRKKEEKLNALMERLIPLTILERNEIDLKELEKAFSNSCDSSVMREIISQVSSRMEGEMKVVIGNDDPFFSGVNPEAEALCARLCLRGVCSGAYSSDSDLLAYGVRNIIRDIGDEVYVGKRTRMFKYIDLMEVLKIIGLKRDSLLELCIICGTDYNDNIRGVGPAKGYNLLKKHGKSEGFPDRYKLDGELVEEVRRIFSSAM